MNVTLTPELEKYVEEAIATGRFSSASEVISASLRKQEEDDKWMTDARKKIQEGLDDIAAGRVITQEDFLAELTERHLQRA